MLTPLSDQELHHLAMNIVGSEMEELGFEFLSINSKPKKDPQFVALKDKKLHFVVVRAVRYPDNPVHYDEDLVNKVRDHGIKFKARTYYAGVGLANSKNYEMPVHHEDDYVVNFAGLIEIK
ncbi:Na(+)-translocating NADH-quinone reductase subunit F [Nonlabens xiamenensis]|uniref:Na(+)-translocating NADH-quinone reductase subunit F n=1 Tax=Nonlabens xiamenensis TaxID=2341043 RepID=UPI000F61006C|nr:Na(+)-translocating NADH-quinone reductase subunit F [Nonlabens xiamenensis]